ncbi:MAG: Grx4 family monothiol glutaredoxin [Xanthomonadales bacterium]|nr:Grx4 family monothiol glutaredoxin [Xanthomonadales bacterium]
MALSENARKTIEGLLDTNRIVLFMKGTPQTPMCGFSARAAGILASLQTEYASFNVLESEEIREGIKEFGEWPTIPQLYIDGELVGGSDIVAQMFNTGELHDLLGVERPDRTPPEISISDKAAEAIRAGMDGYDDVALHLQIDDYWRAQFLLQPVSGDEITVESAGIKIHMDILTAQRARGMEIDYTESIEGTGLTVRLPGAPPEVKSLSVQELKERMDDDAITVVDVRPESERQQAPFPNALVLDKAGMGRLKQFPKDTPLAFLCHVGQSSQGYAAHYRKEGYTDLYNVVGGIDAWSREIDDSVPRY